MKIKNKHRLKQKEYRRLIDEIHRKIDPSFSYECSMIETGKIDDIEFIFFDGIPCFFRKDGILFYSLKGLIRFTPSNRSVVVDMGAVKFITNGADVMAPGIVSADNSIMIDDMVWICDETYRKPHAVGIAELNGSDMVKSTKGKAVRIYHYIGDMIWKYISCV